MFFGFRGRHEILSVRSRTLQQHTLRWCVHHAGCNKLLIHSQKVKKKLYCALSGCLCWLFWLHDFFLHWTYFSLVLSGKIIKKIPAASIYPLMPMTAWVVPGRREAEQTLLFHNHRHVTESIQTWFPLQQSTGSLPPHTYWHSRRL